MSAREYEIIVDEDYEPTIVVRLKGRLDASAVEELRRSCMEHGDEGRRPIVIDMSELSFIASSGLGTLLMLKEVFDEQGGRVVYSAPSPAVRQVIDVLNLGQFLDSEPSIEAAVAVVVA